VEHLWGTLVALAFATRHRAEVAGLVLLSGYYFPNFRIDAMLVAIGAIPLLGDILRYTISPLFGWLAMPLTKRLMFAPASMTDRFQAEYSSALALRPWQIRATVVDGAMPVVVIAGDRDLVASQRHAKRLHDADVQSGPMRRPLFQTPPAEKAWIYEARQKCFHETPCLPN
jgi:pimeloyl-ACP methyl ester carboxylesterase